MLRFRSTVLEHDTNIRVFFFVSLDLDSAVCLSPHTEVCCGIYGGEWVSNLPFTHTHTLSLYLIETDGQYVISLTYLLNFVGPGLGEQSR